MASERLQKILSNAGTASRRQAEAMIVAGRVAVNGKIMSQLGSRADLDSDVVTLDGEPVIKSAYVYLLLNKPVGVVTSARDERGRRTVLQFAPTDPQLHPVGRLDVDSEGLVILTNDGELTNRLTHPKFEVDKEYLVGIHMPVSKTDQRRMVRGIEDGGERLRAASVQTVDPDGTMDLPPAGGWLLIVLRQGRNREIRRMMTALGRRVVHLRRIRIGPLALGALPVGETRPLTEDEVVALYKASKQLPENPAANDKQRKKPVEALPKTAATTSATTATAVTPAAPPTSANTEIAVTPAAPPTCATKETAVPPAAATTSATKAKTETKVDTSNAPRVIALDGTAASGKTTLGQKLAERFGHALLDTGSMYRAFTLAAQRAEIPPSDLASCRRLARGIDMRISSKGSSPAHILLSTEDVTGVLRTPPVESSVSDYAAIPEVRNRLVDLQREFAKQNPCVMVGRDIGTVVLPDAEAKIFLTASEDARAKRRNRQAGEWGVNQAEGESRADIAGRDKTDTTRATSPLKPADGAVVIDTTDLTAIEVLAAALEGIGCASD